MGWARGVINGREVGYDVEATCDEPGCERVIDRGVSYLCGGIRQLHGGDGCGGYFCWNHLYAVGSLCQKCRDEQPKCLHCGEHGWIDGDYCDNCGEDQ